MWLFHIIRASCMRQALWWQWWWHRWVAPMTYIALIASREKARVLRSFTHDPPRRPFNLDANVFLLDSTLQIRYCWNRLLQHKQYFTFIVYDLTFIIFPIPKFFIWVITSSINYVNCQIIWYYKTGPKRLHDVAYKAIIYKPIQCTYVLEYH